jgi:peptide/nickel transport system substrate-binding protein
VDPATNAVGATIPVGNGPTAVAVGQGAVWVADQYAGAVSEIDPASDTVARTITVGNRPEALASAAGRVWVGAGPAVISHRGGTLNVLVQGDPADTFDPVLSQNLSVLLPLTNDGLTAYQHVAGSGSVQIVPDLAVSLPSPTDGGKTYTFQLRRGIRYSNGQLVRPQDFRRALERELRLAPNHPFADVIGGAACAANPSQCDLSRGVIIDDAANTVTFHLVAPDPELLAKLTHPDAVAVPAGTPNHDIGLHPLPATGPYEWASLSLRSEGTLVRNPLFHEWSHAARPDGYPDKIVFRVGVSPSAGLMAVERGSADYMIGGVPASGLNDLQTRFAKQLHVTPAIATDALILNTRVAPFTDVHVRRAISYAIDRAKIARLLGQEARPACQILPPSISGYRRYCPYTTDPNTAGTWQGPNLAEANRLIAASHTRGTPITIWNLGGYNTDYTTIEPYLVSLLGRLGYPTTVKDLQSGVDPNAPLRFADSRTKAQAALTVIATEDPSASPVIQANFACQSFKPQSQGNANLSEFCDPSLDNQVSHALTAESNNATDTAPLWAQADRIVTDLAPAVPVATPTNIDFVSARVGDYQYNAGPGLPVLLDQLWVR